MKKTLKKFAASLLTKEQMKGIKGGVLYCVCEGVLYGFPDNAQGCSFYCSGGGHCGCCASGCGG
jgi:hypothetical protein